MLTAMADEFGGPIPVGPFALIGDDSIGQGIVATLKDSRSPAVLMQNHGVFTIGPSAKAAVKAAVMTEDVARTVHLSRQLGEPDPDRAGGHRLAVRALPERLRPAMSEDSPVAFEGQQVWFLTGSQGLYGEETLQQVAEQSAAGGGRAGRRRRGAGAGRLEAGAQGRRRRSGGPWARRTRTPPASA